MEASPALEVPDDFIVKKHNAPDNSACLHYLGWQASDNPPLSIVFLNNEVIRNWKTRSLFWLLFCRYKKVTRLKGRDPW